MAAEGANCGSWSGGLYEGEYVAATAPGDTTYDTGGVIAQVGVGSTPQFAAYDSGNGDVYVANTGANTVSVISGATNTVVGAPITVGTNPIGVAYDSGNGDVYVANNGAGTVSVISGATNAVVATVAVGTFPIGVGYDSGNGDVYVANYGAGTVSVISGATNAVVATVTVGSGPNGVGYDSGNGDVYVANYGAGTVSVISTLLGVGPSLANLRGIPGGGAIGPSVAVGTYPYFMAFDPDNGDVYVANYGPSTVSVISGVTNAVVATVTVGTNPIGVAYDSGNGDVYVANDGSNNVSVIAGVTNTVVATVPVGTTPIGVAYDSGNGDVYVVNYGANTVSVISGVTNAVVVTVPVGTNPYGVAYDSGNGDVYVANEGANTVSVISTLSSTTPDPPVTMDVGQSMLITSSLLGQGAGGDVLTVSSSPGTGLSCSVDPLGYTLVSGACMAGAAGVYTVTFRVVDALGATVSTSIELTVDSDPSVSAPGLSRLSVDVGQTVSLSVTPSGGSDSYAYAWTGLPPGCASADVPTLYCTPSGATGSPFSVGVSVVDTNNYTVVGGTAPLEVYPDPTVGIPSSSSLSVDVGQTVVFTAVPSGGTGAYSYSWAGLPPGCNSLDAARISCTPTSPTGSPFAVGVTVTDTNGVAATAPSPLSFSVYADPAVSSLTASSGSVDVGMPLTFTTSATGGAPTLTYAWTASSSNLGCPVSTVASVTCTPVGPGSFTATVTVTDGNAFSVQATSVAVTVYPDPVVGTPSPSVASADVGQTVVFSTSVSGGSGGFSYAWSAPANLGCGTATGSTFTCTPSSVTGSPFGVSVKVADSNGMNASGGTIPYRVFGDPSLSSLTTSKTSVDAGQTLIVNVIANGGSGSYGFLWSGYSLADGCAIASQGVSGWLNCTPNSSAAGTTLSPSVMVSDGNGWKVQGTAPGAIIYADPSVTLPVASRYALDVSQTTLLTSTSAVPAGSPTYSWIGLPSGCTGTGTLTVSCTPLTVGIGTYTVSAQVTDGNGVTGTSGQITLTISPLPTVNGLAPSVSSLDVGQSVVISAAGTPGSGGITFSWKGLPTACSGSSTWVVTCGPTTSGTASVTLSVTDSNGGTATWNTPVVLTIFAAPIASLPIATPSAGDVGQVLMFTARATPGSGGDVYAWWGLPTGCLSKNATQLSCTPTGPGSDWIGYSVEDSNGVNVTSGSLEVVISASLGTLTLSATPTVLDVGSRTTLSIAVAGGASPLSILWSGLPDGCAGSSTLTLLCTPSASGTYAVKVTVTDANGASLTSNGVFLVVDAMPTVGTPSATRNSLDVGETTNLSVAVSAATGWLTITWKGLPPGCTGSNQSVLSCGPSTPGTYAVWADVVDANGMVAVGQPLNLAVLPALGGASLASTATVIDAGESLTLSAQVMGGSGTYQYFWSGLPSGCIGADSASVTCAPTAAGTSTVTVRIMDSNGAFSSATQNLTVNGVLGISVAVSPQSATSGTTLTFTATAEGGTGTLSYSWYLNGSRVSGATGVTMTLADAKSGNYVVWAEVADGTGAHAISSSMTVEVTAPASSNPGSTSTTVQLPPVEEYALVGMLGLLLVIAVLLALIARRSRRMPTPPTRDASTSDGKSPGRDAMTSTGPGQPTQTSASTGSPSGTPSEGSTGNETRPSEWAET